MQFYAEYHVTGPTAQLIYENDWSLKFMDAFRAANAGDASAFVTTGEQV